MKLLLIISLFSFILFLPQTIQAANPLDVVISEIAWMGTQTAHQDEWIELYNNIGSQMDLSGWVLKAEDGTPKIKLAGTIPANGYFLLERTDDTTLPDILADQIYTGALANTGEYLKLFDNQGNLIDEVNFSGGWPAGDNNTKQTMERKNQKGSGNDTQNWQTSQNPGGTPKAQNSGGKTPPPPPPEPSPPQPEPQQRPEPSLTQTYPANIFINEFLPSPEGPDEEEEFIELYNSNAFSVDISNWKIEDTQGAIKTYTFPNGTTIKEKGFLALFRPTSKIVLDNEGEGLILKNPLGNIVHSISYQRKAPQGSSYARKSDGTWQWTFTITPGEENSFAILEEKPETQPKTGKKPIPPEAETLSKEKTQQKEEEIKPISYPSGILINEILPSPEGSDETEEWIEIFNSNNFEVDISAWKIQDTKGIIKSYSFPQGTKISPGGFLVFWRPTSKITLNNDSDGLKLINPNGDIVDQVNYEKAPPGQSYNRILLEDKSLPGQETEWVWSENLTPGAPNVTTQISEEEEKTIEVSEKGLAAIGQKFPKFPRFFFVFFIAITIAIFFGIIILFLKKKVKKNL